MGKGGRSEQGRIKDSNARRILHLLRTSRELSKQKISLETGISIPTVTHNVERLIEQGMAAEAGVSASTGGRRPMLVRFLPAGRLAFGVDFASNHLTSSSNVRVVLIDLDARILRDESIDYREFSSVSEIMAHIGALARRIAAEESVPLERILGIGISLPGTVNERKKILELAPNLAPSLGMQDLHFRSYEKLFPFSLYVESEANAAAFAELVLGIAQHKRSLVYLSVNRGIGAGIVVRGHLYKGNDKRAGQVPHLALPRTGIRCTCGMLDCWEIYAASGALIRNYNAESVRKIEDTRQFLGLLRDGDPIAEATWERYLDDVAVGVSNLLLCYDPDYLVVGGEITQFGDFLLEPLKARVFGRNTFYGKDEVEILLSTLREDAAVLGAALLPFQRLLYGGNKII